MITKVEIYNNPYAHKVRILIDRKAPSAYSPLEKFVDEPFLYWHKRIFDELEKELNGGQYTLFFESRKEEIPVMEKLALAHPLCRQFTSREIMRNTPLIKRMASLSSLLKNSGITGFRHFTKKALFILPDGERRLQDEIREINVENRYCKIESSSVQLSSFSKRAGAADILFLVSRPEQAESLLKKGVISSGFMIILSDHTGYEKTEGNIPVFHTTGDDFFDTVFDCFILGPLSDVFYDCIGSLPEDVRTRYKNELELLQSTSVRITAKPESMTIEKGKSISIRFEGDIEGYKISDSDLEFAYREKGVLRCNGLRVDGLRAGSTVMYVYLKGERDPCTSIKLNVIERNRVTDLTIEDKSVIIGEGDSFSLGWNYNPPDADNLSKVEWSSENPSVLKIDQKGRIRALSAGESMIRITCEQVSDKTLVHVLPHIEDIAVGHSEIVTYPGGSLVIEAHTVPEVTIEGGLKMAVMDARIANAVSGRLEAFATGETVLVIQDKKERLRKEIPVRVISEKQYKKKYETRSKKGFLSALFG